MLFRNVDINSNYNLQQLHNRYSYNIGAGLGRGGDIKTAAFFTISPSLYVLWAGTDETKIPPFSSSSLHCKY